MGSSKALADLAATVGGTVSEEVGEHGTVLIDDVTHDSRQAGPGELFVAVRGLRTDGHSYVRSAVSAGSPAVCVDHRVHAGVPELIVDDTRAALGLLASAVHDDPSHAMSVIGVTGTNGKTTVTHYVESISNHSARPTGLIGTIETRMSGASLDSVMTTPEASDFQRLLATMRDRGVTLVACEVSSHALALHRVRGTRFAVAAFTNLSHDHLDFHGSMDAYLSAKRSLFLDYDVGVSVINIDDSAGAAIASDVSGEKVTVGEGGDVRIARHRPAGRGTAIELTTQWGSIEVLAPVFGSFNVSNVAVATACCLASGISIDEVSASLESLDPVPGRFEVVSGEDPIRIVVDYAHTPDGIAQSIEAARSMAPRRLIAVFGAGGDRDRQKRPLMGEAASSADVVVVTTDNPRSEDPALIASAVRSGVGPGVASVTELDRIDAIRKAVQDADEGDIVLILGRGHEPFQEVAGRRLPLDDRKVARQALDERRVAEDPDARSGSMAP